MEKGIKQFRYRSITVRLSENELNNLKGIALSFNTSVSEILRNCIKTLYKKSSNRGKIKQDTG